MIFFAVFLISLSFSLFSNPLNHELSADKWDQFYRAILKNQFSEKSFFLFAKNGNSKVYPDQFNKEIKFQFNKLDDLFWLLSYLRLYEEVMEKNPTDIGRNFRKNKREFPQKPILHIEQLLRNDSNLLDLNFQFFPKVRLESLKPEFGIYSKNFGGSYESERLLFKDWLFLNFPKEQIGSDYYIRHFKLSQKSGNSKDLLFNIKDLSKILEFLSFGSGQEGSLFWSKAIQKKSASLGKGFPSSGLLFHEYFFAEETSFLLTFQEDDSSYLLLVFPESKEILFFYTNDSNESKLETFLNLFRETFYEKPQISILDETQNQLVEALEGNYIDSFANLNGINRWIRLKNYINIKGSTDNTIRILFPGPVQKEEEFFFRSQTLLERINGGAQVFLHYSNTGEIDSISYSGLKRYSFRRLKTTENIQYKNRISFYFIIYFSFILTIIILEKYIIDFLNLDPLPKNIKFIRNYFGVLSFLFLIYELLFYIKFNFSNSKIHLWENIFFSMFPLGLLGLTLILFYHIGNETLSKRLNLARIFKYYVFLILVGMYFYFLNQWAVLDI